MDFDKYALDIWENIPEESGSKEREARILSNINRRLFRGRRLFRIFTASAAIAASVAAIFVTLYLNRESETVPVTELVCHTSTQNELMELPDGSKVWLKEGSTLSYPRTMSCERDVYLSGEAVFDVVRTEDMKEFSVNLKSSKIIVRGTSFSVDENREGVDVVLYTGAIDFVANGSGQVVSMKPGHSLSFKDTESSIRITPSFDGIYWKDGKYIIDNSSLANLVLFLSWKFDKTITIAGSIPNNQCFNGIIRFDESLPEILESICFILGLEYRQTDDGYSII